MMNAKSLIMNGLLAALAWTAPARGEISFAAGEGAYTVVPGQQVQVPLYFVFGGPDRDRLVNEGGLLSAVLGLRVDAPLPPWPVLISAIDGNAAAFDDPLFPPLASLAPDGQSASLAGASLSGAAGQEDGAVRRVLLGTATFDAPAEIGMTTWRLFDEPAFDDTFLGSGFIDDEIGDGLLEITVLPSPGGVMTLLPATLLFLRRRAIRSGWTCRRNRS